jgi:membrane protein
MQKSLDKVVKIVKEATNATLDNGHITSAAAIAFYTIFSLPGLLITVIMIAGVFLGQEAVTGQLSNQIDGFMGASAADTIESIIANIELSGNETSGTIIGIATLIFSATTVFVTLQAALNKTWDAEPDNYGGWITYIMERLVSFGMVISLGFIFVVSLLADTFLQLMMDKLNGLLGFTYVNVVEVASFVMSSMTVMVLFTAIFTVLPDVKLRWRQVWKGSFFTYLLFMLGKILIGQYIQSSDFSQTYESAGSTILILVWVYYSTIILLYGAELTKALIKDKELFLSQKNV